ncbi:MAG: cell division protein SepF [Clostridiales bacterium]|jgi:cell division inhibitor SepF|nr:cell division protein SepF [Clostridiales bacterium]
MAGTISKIMNFIGLESEVEEEFYEPPAARDVRPRSYRHEDDYAPSNKRSKVVNINTTARLNVVIMNPENFEDAQDIADHIKTKKPCVVNLENIEKDVARRIVDFLSGAIYAVDGNIQKVSSGIFLVAPYNVSIMGDFKDELRSKGVFPWN